MILIRIQMEETMRIASTFATMVPVAFGLAVAAPTPVLAGDGANPFHKHAFQTHQVVYASYSANATALAVGRAVAPAVPATETDGLSRNLDDCVRYGCIGSN
jgi:hypothetical protein